MSTLIEIRDDALDAAAPHHDRIRQELAIYRNEAYVGGEGNRVGRVFSMAGESLDPKVRKGVNRMVSGFIEQMARIEIQPDRSYRTEEDIELCEDIQNWLDMHDDALDEGEEMRVAVQHNLSVGHAVSKIGWDERSHQLTAGMIHPLSFSVDPRCRKVNLSDAQFVNHREFQSAGYVARVYDDFDLAKLKRHQNDDRELLVVDELWVRPAEAAACGVKVDADADGVVQAVFINDVFHRCRMSPYWWPDFPFATWRNFVEVDSVSGKANAFWGHGYGTHLWSNQKLLDEMLANLVLISRNTAVGRFISKRGMLDMEQVLPIHGLNIEFPDGFTLQDLMHLPPEAIPPVFFQIVQLLSQSMDEEIPSLSDVFTGEAPFQGASGRAVNALQYAAFSQLSTNIRAMNDFRVRRARMKVTMLQQFARRLLRPHAWRGGLDLPASFPEDARYVGYQVSLPDTSALPNTPAGRLQVVQMLANMGMVMSPERMLEFIGLDKGFGLKAEDFVPMQMGPEGAGAGAPAQLDEGVVSGIEAAMTAER